MLLPFVWIYLHSKLYWEKCFGKRKKENKINKKKRGGAPGNQAAAQLTLPRASFPLGPLATTAAQLPRLGPKRSRPARACALFPPSSDCQLGPALSFTGTPGPCGSALLLFFPSATPSRVRWKLRLHPDLPGFPSQKWTEPLQNSQAFPRAPLFPYIEAVRPYPSPNYAFGSRRENQERRRRVCHQLKLLSGLWLVAEVRVEFLKSLSLSILSLVRSKPC